MTRSIATVMDDLGFLWDSSADSANLYSKDDYDYGNATFRNDTLG